MELEKAEKMAIDLMAKYGLHEWSFRFGTAKKTFGSCCCEKKNITLSKILTSLNTEEEVQEVILHEVAHALDFLKRGFTNHDKQWKKLAISIGATGSTYAGMNVITPGQYVAICPHCGTQITTERKRNLACWPCCRKFNRGKYHDDYKLIFQN